MLCLHVYLCIACVLDGYRGQPEEGIRFLRTGVRQLRTAMCALGTEPDSSRSAACALNH